jgi:hypothetical protein
MGFNLLETCIKCGTLTTTEKITNVKFRSGYIEGAGQLCFECVQKYDKEMKIKRELKDGYYS